MRYLITLFAVCLLGTLNAQQVDRQMVVLEVGTGTWCPSCPAVVDIIHDLEAQGAQIAVVKYHINDVYENVESVARKEYYNFPWYPTTYYDSDHVGYDDWATYAVHESMYMERLATPTSFSVSLDMNLADESILSGYINLEKVAEYEGQNLRLHVALTESNIPDAWYGEEEVSNAVRTMNNFGQGEMIDFSSGDMQEHEFTFYLDSTWVVENCEIIFFLQDYDTKEVLQGDAVDVEPLLSVSSYDKVQLGQIVPNPVNNEFAIQTNDFNTISEVQIFDFAGKEVYRSSAYNDVINVSNLQQGFYIVSYTENNILKTAKFVKR